MKIKAICCQVSLTYNTIMQVSTNYLAQCKPCCSRITEDFINRAKKSLRHIMANPDVLPSEKPFEEFKETLLNFHARYCKDNHLSKWCKYHLRYHKIYTLLLILIYMLQKLINFSRVFVCYVGFCVVEYQTYVTHYCGKFRKSMVFHIAHANL